MEQQDGEDDTVMGISGAQAVLNLQEKLKEQVRQSGTGLGYDYFNQTQRYRPTSSEDVPQNSQRIPAGAGQQSRKMSSSSFPTPRELSQWEETMVGLEVPREDSQLAMVLREREVLTYLAQDLKHTVARQQERMLLLESQAQGRRREYEHKVADFKVKKA